MDRTQAAHIAHCIRYRAINRS